MIGLIFKLGADSTPFRQEMAKTEAAAKAGGDNAGKFFGAQFKAGVMRFLGAGAVISFVQKTMQEAFRIDQEAMKQGIGVEAFQELERAADAAGMTVDELREAAPLVAKQFAELMSSIRDAGGILDKETVDTLSNAAAQLKDFGRSFAPLIGVLVKVANINLGRNAAATKAALAVSVGDYSGALQQIMAGDYAGNRPAIAASATRSKAQQLTEALSFNRKIQASVGAVAGVKSDGIASMPFGGTAIDALISAAREQTVATKEVAETLKWKL